MEAGSVYGYKFVNFMESVLMNLAFPFTLRWLRVNGEDSCPF